MSAFDKALERCAGHGHIAEFARAPFSAAVDGRPVRIATNGSVLLVTDDPVGDASAGCDQMVLSLIGRCRAPPTHHASRDDLIAWAGPYYRTPCMECEHGFLGVEECKRCRGECVVMCYMGEEHDCPACGASGFTGTPHAACCATGFLHDDSIPIDIPALPAILDAHRIGGLFDLLPGEQVGISDAKLYRSGGSPVIFYGVGWTVIVNAMRYPSRTPARHLNALPIVEAAS